MADLWIVTNNWLGNLNEGAIVEAADQTAAIAAAKVALTAHWEAKRERYGLDHANEHIASYQGDELRWWAERIELPYVGEF